jgi:hypothetical protein
MQTDRIQEMQKSSVKKHLKNQFRQNALFSVETRKKQIGIETEESLVSHLKFYELDICLLAENRQVKQKIETQLVFSQC